MAAIDAFRQGEIMEAHNIRFHGTNPDKSEKTIVTQEAEVERFLHQNILPVGADVPLSLKLLDLIGFQVPPGTVPGSDLLVAQIVFIQSGWNLGPADEIVSVLGYWYSIHDRWMILRLPVG
jgi:hypothetical protein